MRSRGHRFGGRFHHWRQVHDWLGGHRLSNLSFIDDPLLTAEAVSRFTLELYLLMKLHRKEMLTTTTDVSERPCYRCSPFNVGHIHVVANVGTPDAKPAHNLPPLPSMWFSFRLPLTFPGHGGNQKVERLWQPVRVKEILNSVSDFVRQCNLEQVIVGLWFEEIRVDLNYAVTSQERCMTDSASATELAELKAKDWNVLAGTLSGYHHVAN